MTTITIYDAVISLTGHSTAFGINNEEIVDWDNAEIKTNIAQPTQSELDAEVIRLQAEYDSQE